MVFLLCHDISASLDAMFRKLEAALVTAIHEAVNAWPQAFLRPVRCDQHEYG
jgi:hypothetical protein